MPADARVFDIALNGYATRYAPLLRTHAHYAERLGIVYRSVTRPWVVREPALPAWLTISVLIRALAAGRPYLAHIDADSRVRADAPGFREVFAPGSDSTAMARGRSGRFNSGVILVRNDRAGRDFLQAVLSSATEPVPDALRTGLMYENGNVELRRPRRQGLRAVDSLEHHLRRRARRPHPALHRAVAPAAPRIPRAAVLVDHAVAVGVPAAGRSAGPRGPLRARARAAHRPGQCPLGHVNHRGSARPPHCRYLSRWHN